MAVSKKRVIKSLENLSGDLRELIQEQYPTGYEGSITRITNAKKEPIFVFPLETEDATYLIKVPAIKNSDGEYDVEKRRKRNLATTTVELVIAMMTMAATMSPMLMMIMKEAVNVEAKKPAMTLILIKNLS